MPYPYVIPVRVAERLEDVPPPEAQGMPVNLDQTDGYLVVDAGLPRCLPDRIHVAVAAGKMQIRAERHPGEAIREERTYLLAELPDGAIGRMLDLPAGDWAFADADAHFNNGLLTISIPTQARAGYLRQMQTA